MKLVVIAGVVVVIRLFRLRRDWRRHRRRRGLRMFALRHGFLRLLQRYAWAADTAR